VCFYGRELTAYVPWNIKRKYMYDEILMSHLTANLRDIQIRNSLFSVKVVTYCMRHSCERTNCGMAMT
jgi:hypothetical protein